MMRSPVIATASWTEKVRSTVMTLPLKSTRSGAGGRGSGGVWPATTAGVAQAPASRSDANHAGSIPLL